MTARISLVAAVAANGVIGADGDLIWRISDDLAHFKSLTMAKPMIMGRKTFQSIGKALPGRDSIVMTRDPAFVAPGGFIVRSMRASLSLAQGCARARGVDEICVIGGGEIYAQFLPRADRIYLTRVEAEVEGDAWFPDFDARRWREKSTGRCEESTRNSHACEFFILDRR